jgi:ribosomal protein S6
MTRPYEFVYIFDSALEESQIDEHLARLHQVITSPDNPNPVTETSHWGRRTLAYTVAGKEVGHYVIVRCDAQPDSLTELERQIKLEPAVLRHLIVLNEGLAPLTPDEAETEAPATATETEAPATAAETEAPATAAETEAPATAAETEAPAAAAEGGTE